MNARAISTQDEAGDATRGDVYTRVARIFPNQEYFLPLVRTMAVQTHEGWLEEHRYLNKQLLAAHKREQLRQLQEAA